MKHTVQSYTASKGQPCVTLEPVMIGGAGHTSIYIWRYFLHIAMALRVAAASHHDPDKFIPPPYIHIHTPPRTRASLHSWPISPGPTSSCPGHPSWGLLPLFTYSRCTKNSDCEQVRDWKSLKALQQGEKDGCCPSNSPHPELISTRENLKTGTSPEAGWS
jgi:hypothetical protein